MLDDFLYICDDAYKSSEVIEMERNILKSVDFDLGIPLSYRFLRRYSKVSYGRSPLLFQICNTNSNILAQIITDVKI